MPSIPPGGSLRGGQGGPGPPIFGKTKSSVFSTNTQSRFALVNVRNRRKKCFPNEEPLTCPSGKSMIFKLYTEPSYANENLSLK